MFKLRWNLKFHEHHSADPYKSVQLARGDSPEWKRNPDSFDQLLLTSIDDALLSLGESARQSIYFHIEKNYNVNRNAIPRELDHFQTALEKIFGVGARYIEILIMRNLYGKVGRPLNLGKNEQLEFIKYVEAAQRVFTQKTA